MTPTTSLASRSRPLDYLSASDSQRAYSLDPGSLEGRVVAVTGASGGLGTALSRSLAQAGATLVLIGRDERKLDKLYDALVSAGAQQPAQVPLKQQEATQEAYDELASLIAAELGGLDALVHTSAMSSAPMPMSQIKQLDWARTLAVNVSAARLATVACLPLLNASTLGSVTFLLDHKPGAYWGAYGVSKQAVHALMSMLADETDGLSGEDGHPRLAINGYDPGPMRTPLRRKAFPGELEEESPPPTEKLGPLLALLTRADRSLTGTALHHD